jgi:hypothetical protein
MDAVQAQVTPSSTKAKDKGLECGKTIPMQHAERKDQIETHARENREGKKEKKKTKSSKRV